MEDSTVAFTEYVRQAWYYDGCDVTSTAPGIVEVNLPPEFPISEFCADVSYAPHNATVEVVTGASGTRAVCRLNSLEPAQMQSTKAASSRGSGLFLILSAAVVVIAMLVVSTGDVTLNTGLECNSTTDCLTKLRATTTP